MNDLFWIPTAMALASLLWNYAQSKEIVKLEKDAERSNLMHKYQFDKEFKLYEDLWSGLIDLRRDVLTLRPVMDFRDPGKTEEEIKMERLATYYKSLESVGALFEKNKPFFPESIFKQIFDLLKITRFEAISYQFKERQGKSMDYWHEAEENSKKILDAMDKISDAIRKRVTPTEV